MGELYKDGKCSFTLKLSRNDASMLYKYLEDLNSYKYTLFFNGREVDFNILIDEINDSLIINNQSITIYMDNEEIDYFERRLIESIKGKDFYPAELCERRMNNKNVTIYCFVE